MKETISIMEFISITAICILVFAFIKTIGEIIIEKIKNR